MIEKDILRSIKIHRDPDGRVSLIVTIEHCFVDEANTVIAVKPNPLVWQCSIAETDPALLPLLGLIADLRKAELDAAAAG